MLNNRCANILTEIVNSHRSVTIKSLAGIFNVSYRTVRYDLDEIDYYLKCNRLAPICRKTNVGVHFTGNDSERREVLEHIALHMETGTSYTSCERRLIILVCRCLCEEPFTIESMSGYLGVSISTTLKDIEYLRKLLAEFGTEFRAFSLHGDEAVIRGAIVGAFIALLDQKMAGELVRYISVGGETPLNRVYFQMFERMGIDLLRESIRILSRNIPLCLSNEKFLQYSTYLAVQASRLNIGRKLPSGNRLFFFEDNVSDTVAATKELWQKHCIALDDQEVQYLLQIVEKAKYDTISPNEPINMADLQLMAFAVSKKTLGAAGLPAEYDKALIDGLLDEIPKIIIRAKAGIHRKQYFVRALADYSPELFAAVRLTSAPIALLLNRELNDDEVAALAIYFVDYRERGKIDNHRPKVALLGPERDVALKLVHSRLGMIFAVDIVAELAVYETEALANIQADYLISTCHAVESDIPCIRISPFLSESDVAQLKLFLPLAFQRVHNSHPLPDQGLCEVLREDAVLLDCRCAEILEVIEKSFSIMQANDCVTPGFLQDLFATANDIGLQAVLVDGALFLHSRNFSFSKRLGLVMVRMRDPLLIQKLQPEQSVRFVFTLATPDSAAHMRLLKELIDVLGNDGQMRRLEKASTPSEVLSIFKTSLQSNNQ